MFSTAIYVARDNTNLVISGNLVTNAGVNGIAVDSGATGQSALENSVIERNVVTGSGQTGAGDGIRIEDYMDLGGNTGKTIRENTISGSQNHDVGARRRGTT